MNDAAANRQADLASLYADDFALDDTDGNYLDVAALAAHARTVEIPEIGDVWGAYARDASE